MEVIRENSERFSVSVLTAQNNVDLLICQALEFKPARVVIADEQKYLVLKDALSGSGIEVLAGENGLTEAVIQGDIDLVLTAVVGFCGLKPTLAAIKAGKNIALAEQLDSFSGKFVEETEKVLNQWKTQLSEGGFNKFLTIYYN